jgi:PAS domain S-box-containing protein
MRDEPRRVILGYAIAALAVAAAVLLRWLLDPLLGAQFSLTTLYGAVAVVAWYDGYRPALLAVVLGYLACDFLFIEPREAFAARFARNVVGLLSYLLSCGIIIGLAEAMRIAQRRSRQDQQAASEQQEWLRTTLASIGDAVIATDASGKVVFLNAAAQGVTGWTQGDAHDLPLRAVFKIINEQTRQPVENPVSKVLQQGVVVGLANHTVLISRDGTERPIDDSAAPIRAEMGQVNGVVLVFRDITERRRLELENAERAAAARLLAAIVESSEDAIVSKSLGGIIQTWNAAAERLFGYTAEQAAGRPITLIIPPDRADEEDRIIARIQAGERVEHFDTVRLRSDGQPIPVSLTISPVRDEAGRIVGASKIVRDITERKRLEQALREADRRKDEFLATLAHELRNPLAPLRNALELMRRVAVGGPEVEQVRAMMERQVAQMVRLIDDLLDVSRISRGKVELRKERVELAAVVRSALEATRLLIEAAGHQLTVTLPPEAIHLDADPARLTQVFSNLLNNAVKYTEKGGHIWLTAEQQGSEVVVSVRDTGIGIAAEHLPRLFEMFSQVTSALDRSQGGLGVGLSLVRGVVRLHGGTVEAHSSGPGKGSEFIVRLPVVDGLVPDGPQEPREAGMRTPSSPRGRILVVDDNRDAADSLALMLGMAGHDTRTAYDGLEAVQAVATFRPSVVFLDIGLPKMNGYEAARLIREQPRGKDVALIALTGWGQEEDKRRALEAGFDHHLTKPVDPAALEKLLALIRPVPQH